MTYFGFLLRFLVLPIIVLLLLVLWDRRRGKNLPSDLRGWSPFGKRPVAWRTSSRTR